MYICVLTLFLSYQVANVIPELALLLHQKSGRDSAPLRGIITDTIHSVYPYARGILDAMITQRMPGLDRISEAERFDNPSALLLEATDLSFGSTLSEQVHKSVSCFFHTYCITKVFSTFLLQVLFTDRLEKWLWQFAPSEIPTTADVGTATEWEHILELMYTMIKWLPKLCLALEINAQDSSAGDKKFSSCKTAARQIAILERLMLYALSSSSCEGAVRAIIACVWAPADVHEDIRAPLDNGLIPILNNLVTLGLFIDVNLSFKIQMQIVQLFTRLLSIGHDTLTSLLSDAGLTRSLVGYIRGLMEMIHNVPKLGQTGQFARDQAMYAHSLRITLISLLTSKSEEVELFATAFLYVLKPTPSCS